MTRSTTAGCGSLGPKTLALAGTVKMRDYRSSGGPHTQRPDGQVAQRGWEDELVVRQLPAPLPRVQQPVLAQHQRQFVLRDRQVNIGLRTAQMPQMSDDSTQRT